MPKSLRLASPLLLGLLLGLAVPTAAQEAVVRVAQTRLWAAPRTDAPVLTSVLEGQRLTVVERVNPTWLKVRYTLPTGATVVGFIPISVVEVIDSPQASSPAGGNPSMDVGYIDWRQRLESARSTRRTLEVVGIASGAASLLFTILTFTDKAEECTLTLYWDVVCGEKAKTGYVVGGLVSAGIALIAGATWYSVDRRVKTLELEGLRKGYPQAVLVPTRDGWLLALRWRF